MGLNAVVFRSVRELEKQFGCNLFEVDETTGEAVLKSNKEMKIPRTAFVANQKRLGNLSEVERLRDIVGPLLPTQDSILRKQVLYSASHSGDSVRANDFSQLHEELRLIKLQGLTELATFIDTMESLLLTAEAEGNPIVFV